MIAQRPSDLEKWQVAWRNALAPRLPRRGLEALRKALLCDDQSLLQGRTVRPSQFLGRHNEKAEAACAIGFCGWKSGLDTVLEVTEFFDDLIESAEPKLGPSTCRHFLDWFDETPRSEMRRRLLSEVEKYLAENP